MPIWRASTHAIERYMERFNRIKDPVVTDDWRTQFEGLLNTYARHFVDFTDGEGNTRQMWLAIRPTAMWILAGPSTKHPGKLLAYSCLTTPLVLRCVDARDAVKEEWLRRGWPRTW